MKMKVFCLLRLPKFYTGNLLISIDSNFTSTCQQESVPSVFKMFISMILNDIDLKDNDYKQFLLCLFLSLFIGLKIHTEI